MGMTEWGGYEIRRISPGLGLNIQHHVVPSLRRFYFMEFFNRSIGPSITDKL